MEPVRILQIVTMMNRGGLESMLMNYYRNIDRNKVQFDFLEHRSGKHDFTDEILSLGGRIYTVPSMNPLNTNGYLTVLNDFFQQNKKGYKIVHSHLDCMSKYPLKYAKKNGISVRIAHSHSSSQERNLKYFFKLYSKLGIAKYATHLFACGEVAGKWMFQGNEFNVINNAIDSKRFIYNENLSSKKKKELNLQGKFVIGHVGRFNTVKNHSFLIDIFNETHKKNNQSVLLLAGVGPLQEEIKNKVNRLGLSDVVLFLGVRNDIPDLLQAIDVLVFPSLFEGLPVTLIEAQASGLPCIVSNTVSNEAKITDNIKYVSLNAGVKKWSDEVLSYSKNFIRRDMFNIICEKGFDIKDNSKWLENFYLKCSMGDNNE